ncbi:MAG: DUF120 domain-containing protein [Planctomycetota bacterium]
MALLHGHITSGRGDFAQWIEKYHAHYQQLTGLELYPGTLNLRLAQPYTVPAGSLRLCPQNYGGTVGVYLVPCRVFDRAAFILRTDANERGDGDHPREVIEIATDIKLRDAWDLVDGDLVRVEVTE